MTAFNLSEWALKHRSLTLYFMIVAVAAGVASYFRLGRSEDPSFIIKTMVVQAAWPGATVEDTLKQVTERLERKLQETPKLDFLRSFTRAGVTTIFVNLKGSATASEVPDIWYHVRKSIGDIRHTSKKSDQSSCRYPTYPRSKSSALKMRRFSSSSRRKSLPAWASIAQR